MSKPLTPRPVKQDDYKRWSCNAFELLRRQWLMLLLIGALELALFWLLERLIVNVGQFIGRQNPLLEIVLGVCLFWLVPFLSGRFLYHQALHAGNMSLGKGPILFWNGVRQRGECWLDELVKLSAVFVVLSFSILLCLGAMTWVGAFMVEDMTGAPLVFTRSPDEPLPDYYNGCYLVLIYAASRQLYNLSFYWHKYPLLSCYGLSNEACRRVKTFADGPSAAVLLMPRIGFQGLAMVAVGGYIVSQSLVVDLVMSAMLWATFLFLDALGYVACRDIYFGQDENAPEKHRVRQVQYQVQGV